MGDSRESTFSKLKDDTVLGVVADRPDGYAATQRDVDSLEKWANTNLRCSTKEDAKPCCSGARTGSQRAERKQKKQRKT